MKYNSIILGILIITFSSCQDFLEVPPETSITAANFYVTEQDFEQAIGGAYTPLGYIYENDWILTEMRSDNTYFIYDVANRGSKPEEDFATFLVESNNRNVEGKWTSNYLIIARANQVLASIENADFDQGTMDNLKGQAYFLRALAYFDLVKNYGGVPLFLEPSTSYEGTFTSRATVDETYDQIISDAVAASQLLPEKANQDPGRATLGAAYTLLGDIYITLGRWENAEAALKSVTKLNYNLLANYADVFNPTNWNNNEIIFQVEYLGGTSNSLGSTFPYRFLPVLTDPSIITGVSPANQNDDGSFNIPTPDLLEAYEDTINDTRFRASVGFYSGASPLVGVVYNHTPYINKFQHPHAQYDQTDDNWPIYRYAEVLLMLAESLNEQNRSSEALVHLNEVRNRANLPNITTTNQIDLREIIWHERRIELAFENKRWHDLVRTKRAVTVMAEFGAKVKANPQDYYYPVGSFAVPNSFTVTEDKYIYPIPVSEINVNPAMEQNPGY